MILEKVFIMKKVYVLIGNFGSGKTEISLNLAVKGMENGKSVLVDLDVINPYFRSAERKDILDAAGVKLLYPTFALTTVDVPSLPPDIFSVFIDDHDTVVFDVGGDPAGATALGQYKANFDNLPEGSLEVLYVINPRRPFSAEAGMVLDLMERINYRSRLKVTGLVNNANLAKETTFEDLLDGHFKRNRNEVEEFVLVKLLLRLVKSLRKVHIYHFCIICRRRIEAAQGDKFVSSEACFLTELSHTAFQGIFAPFLLACGDFKEHLSVGITELLYKVHFLVFVYRNNAHAA